MKNKRELKGYWRLPEGEESGNNEWVGGIATYNPDSGIELELFSSLSDEFITEEPPQFDRIFGSTVEGEKVTLENCFRAGFSSKANTEKYFTQNLFIGDHLDESEVNFDYLRIKYPLLHDWTQITGLQPHFSDTGEITVDYVPPSKKEVESSDKIISIYPAKDMSVGWGSISIDEDTFLEIKCKNEDGLSFLEAKTQVNKWMDFLTLATNENISVSRIFGYKKNDEADDRIELFYRTQGNSNYPENFSSYNANFTLPDIDENFSNVISNWIEMSERYEPVYDLYFAVVYQSQMYLENQYMMLITALNMVYQERFDHQYLSEAELEDVVVSVEQAIPAGIDKDFRDHLIEDILPATNQHSIREVLSTIVDRYSNVIGELKWDVNQEVAEIVAMHDHTAGRSHKLQEVDSQNIYDKTMVLRALLEAILLTDIGIPEDHVREKLAQKYDPPRSIRNE